MRLFIAHSGLPRSHWPKTSLWQHSKAGGLLSSQAPGVSQGQSSHSDRRHPLAVLIARCSRRPHNESSVWRPMTAALPQETTDMTDPYDADINQVFCITLTNKYSTSKQTSFRTIRTKKWKIEDRSVGKGGTETRTAAA